MTEQNGMYIPKLTKQGLYDPQFEHDACGVGMVANIKGVKSHSILKQGLEVYSLCHFLHMVKIFNRFEFFTFTQLRPIKVPPHL